MQPHVADEPDDPAEQRTVVYLLEPLKFTPGKGSAPFRIVWALHQTGGLARISDIVPKVTRAAWTLGAAHLIKRKAILVLEFERVSDALTALRRGNPHTYLLAHMEKRGQVYCPLCRSKMD